MEPVKPVFKRLLIAALVVYVIGMCVIQTNMYFRLGRIEHAMMHMELSACAD
jgi:hypothetical protein